MLCFHILVQVQTSLQTCFDFLNWGKPRFPPKKFYNIISWSTFVSLFWSDFLSFRIAKNLIRVPMLVPGLEYTFETLVECISDLGISDQLRVFVIRNRNAAGSDNKSTAVTKPILSAVINMPVAEVVWRNNNSWCAIFRIYNFILFTCGHSYKKSPIVIYVVYDLLWCQL